MMLTKRNCQTSGWSLLHNDPLNKCGFRTTIEAMAAVVSGPQSDVTTNSYDELFSLANGNFI